MRSLYRLRRLVHRWRRPHERALAWAAGALFRLLAAALGAIAIGGLCFGKWAVAIVMGEFALTAALLAATANPKERRPADSRTAARRGRGEGKGRRGASRENRAAPPPGARDSSPALRG